MTTTLTQRLPLLPRPGTADEAAARRALMDQIARLEADVAAEDPTPRPAGRRHGARLLTLAELEQARDRLQGELRERRRARDELGLRQQEMRRLREQTALEPEAYPWVRISNEDVGDPGCVHWHVRPRFGLLGMMLRWWRVRISSGCP